MFTIVQSLRTFLTTVIPTAVTPTIVIPIAVILPECPKYTYIYLNLPDISLI